MRAGVKVTATANATVIHYGQCGFCMKHVPLDETGRLGPHTSDGEAPCGAKGCWPAPPHPLHALVGRTVTEVVTNAEHDVIGFLCTVPGAPEDMIDVIGFSAIGDCCSTSWINHVSNLPALIGGTVTRVEVREAISISETGEPIDRNDCNGDSCIESYGFDVYTEKGSCLIEMRNESNGYYSGWLERIDPNGRETLGDVKTVVDDF